VQASACETHVGARLFDLRKTAHAALFHRSPFRAPN
jgi:hypothetical protein